MYRIRFHGRGGQGIKTAAQILGSAFFGAGFEVQDAPRYGAERRGAPVFAYVRASRGQIHERGVITRPDLVVVADDTLVTVPAAGVTQGLSPRTVLLLATRETPETWRDRLKCPGAVVTLSASAGAGDAAERQNVGAACAGAAARLVGVIERSHLEAAIRNEVGKLGPAAVETTLAAACEAFDAMAACDRLVQEGVEVAAEAFVAPEWIEVPREGVRFEAPDIDTPATSARAQTGLWRTFRPVIDYDRCNRCAWICSTLCPDSAIRVDADHTPRIDYDHCKGCMVCVAVCPPHAIRAEPERTSEGSVA